MILADTDRSRAVLTEQRMSAWYRRAPRIVGVLGARPLITVALLAATARLSAIVFSATRSDGVTIPDERQYLSLSTWMSQGHDAYGYALGYGRSLLQAMPVFLWPLTAITTVFGVDRARVGGSLFVCAFGVLTAVAAAWLASQVVGRRWAIAAGAVVALLPSQVLFSSVVLRESLVWAACAGLAIAVVLANRVANARASIVPVLLSVSAMLILGWTRDQVLVASAWMLLPAVLLGPRRWRARRFVVSLALVVVVPTFGQVGPGGIDLFARFVPILGTLRTNFSMNSETAISPGTVVRPPTTTTITTTLPGGPAVPGGPRPRPTTTTAPPGHSFVTGYAGEVYLVDETAGASFRALPRGAIAVLFRPFPWERSAGGDASFAKAENLLWYLLYALAAIGFVKRGWAARDRLAFPALAFVSITLSSAVVEGNLGTSFRHRGELLWIVAVFAAVGAAAVAERARGTTA